MEQGRAAQQMLYHRNLGLAHKLAYMYYSCSDKAVAYPDLIQVHPLTSMRTEAFALTMHDSSLITLAPPLVI